MQTFTLHTHTLKFDGRSTIAEMIDTAAARGFKTIGISDHFIVHPNIKSTPMYAAALQRGYATMYAESFDEVLSRFVPHYRAIEHAAQYYPKIRVLRGIEVDYFPTATWRDGFDNACKILKPDYKIGSAHFIEYDGRLCNSHDVKHAHPDIQYEMIETYWKNVARAAGSNLFNWMAHLDLMKKTGIRIDGYWIPHENAALDAIAATNTGIEINTSGFDEPYPSSRILRAAAARNIPVLISDDAHHATHIGCDFQNAFALAKTNGINKLWDLKGILTRTK